jgi:hypothetical protein
MRFLLALLGALQAFFKGQTRRKVAAGSVMALAGVSVFIGSATIPVQAPTANLWVDTDGGTCVDNASPVEYSSATACASLDAANDTCEGGDTVIIKGGTYGSQAVTGFNSRSSTHCTMTEADGESASVSANVRFGTPSDTATRTQYLTVEGLAFVTDLQAFEGTNNVTVRGFDGGDMYYRGTTGGMIVEQSDFGPCQSPSGAATTATLCESNVKVDGGTVDGLIFRDNDVHDFDLVNPDHYECVFFAGGDNITFERNRFWNCEIYGIFLQPAAGTTSNIYIQNNWFGASPGGGGGVVIGSNSGGLDDVVVRFNSFADGESLSYESGTFSNFRAVGNTFGEASGTNTCRTGIDFDYNVFKSGTCANGTGNTNFGGTMPYADGDGTDSGMDLHLTGATNAADDLVPTAQVDGCDSGEATTDYDSASRPAETNCDAGSDERTD